MRKSTGAAGLLLALLAIATLVGCSEPKHSVIPAPQPSATPIFATDEDALAAAEKAYAEYLAVSDAIAAEGGVNPERAAGLVTDEMLSQIQEAAKSYTEPNLHTVGASTFDSARLQQYLDDGSGTASVTLYVCLDVGQVRVLDDSNIEVTPVSRDSRVPLEIAFRINGESPSLQLERSDLWDGTDFCE